jgi:hypothetical protein
MPLVDTSIEFRPGFHGMPMLDLDQGFFERTDETGQEQLRKFRQESERENFAQIKLRQPLGQLVPLEKLKDHKLIAQIVKFFHANSYINTENFPLIERLLLAYFKDAQQSSDKLFDLSEDLDRGIATTHKFGKVILAIHPSSNAGFLKLSLRRSAPQMKNIEQFISFTLNADSKSRFFTTYAVSQTAVELIRSRKDFKTPLDLKAELDCDAAVWKSFNAASVLPKNYMKTLDCIERHHLQWKDFVRAVNLKSISNVLLPDLIKQSSIKTNAKNLSLLDITLASGQLLQAKITKYHASLRISR